MCRAKLMKETWVDRACGRVPDMADKMKGDSNTIPAEAKDTSEVRVETTELVDMIVPWRTRMDDLGHGEVTLPDDASCWMCSALDLLKLEDAEAMRPALSRYFRSFAFTSSTRCEGGRLQRSSGKC